LLLTRPFQNVPIGTMRYLHRPHGKKAAPCQDYARLIDVLANELWLYDHLSTVSRSHVPQLQARLNETLGMAVRDLYFLSGLYGTQAMKRVRKSLLRLYDMVNPMLVGTPPDSGRRGGCSQDDFYHILVDQLFNAVRQYGPLKATDRFIDLAVAAMLQDFGVEYAGTGTTLTLDTIADTYRQRRVRGAPAPSPHAQELYALCRLIVTARTS
jgi:hypothetical protein